MPTKKKRSRAQIAATRKMLAANRSKRRAAAPKRRAKAVKRRAAVTRRAKPAKRAKRGKRSVKATTKRRAKRRARKVKNVVASRGTTVVVRKVRRGKVRGAKKRSGRAIRRVRVNPGASIGLLDGFTDFKGNLAAIKKSGIKGWAFALIGAGGAVFAGTTLNRVTTPVLANIAPKLVMNPIFARLWSAGNAYLGGFLLAKLMPLDAQTKKAILMGGTVAAAVELAKPGLVASVAGKIPVIGPLFDGAMARVEGLGEYVRVSLAGYYSVEEQSLNGYYTARGGKRLSGYVNPAHNNSADAGSVQHSDALNGLGCSFADQVVSVIDDGSNG